MPHVPITTGNGVYFPRDKRGHLPVGAGPPDSTANGYLQNRSTRAKLPLWIFDFSADFSATGVEAQSRMKKDFFPRFFSQPRYLIKGQTPNQYEYQKLGKFIRQGMLGQVASAPLTDDNPYFEAFVLYIEGFDYGPSRTTKGSHAGWMLEGYIETVATGGERFNNAPGYELTFVLANALAGPMRVFDSAYAPKVVNNFREKFLSGFGDPISIAELQDTTVGNGAKTSEEKPTKAKVPPVKSSDPENPITGNLGSDGFLKKWNPELVG